MQRLSLGPLAPFLKQDLNLSATQVGTFMSAASFGYMLSLIPCGWLVDRIGVRKMLLIGQLICGIFIASMFTAQTYLAALVFLGLAGLGMGCLMPSTTKGIILWFPVKERATAMGLKQTALNIGGIVTAVTLPTVALNLGWNYGFLFLGIFALVTGIMSFILYKQPPPDPADSVARVTAAAGHGTSVRTIFKSRDIWLIALCGMCLTIVEFSILTHFVLYLRDRLLFTVVTAGFILALLEGGGAFGKPISGFMSDRLFHGGRKRIYVLMVFVTGVICLAWSFLVQGSPVWLVAMLAVVLGLSAISWAGVHLTLVAEIAGKELAGAVTGMSTAFLCLGNTIGPPIFGYIIDKTASYKMAWQFMAVMSVIALALLIFVREEKRRI